MRGLTTALRYATVGFHMDGAGTPVSRRLRLLLCLNVDRNFIGLEFLPAPLEDRLDCMLPLVLAGAIHDRPEKGTSRFHAMLLARLDDEGLIVNLIQHPDGREQTAVARDGVRHGLAGGVESEHDNRGRFGHDNRWCVPGLRRSLSTGGLFSGRFRDELLPKATRATIFHQRRIQGTSRPSLWQRSMAA